MDMQDNEIPMEKLTLNEEILVDVLRHFDFLRAYNFSITRLSLFGREHYLVYSSKQKQLYIKWDTGFEVELRSRRFIKYKCVDISNLAKQYGILLDTGYTFERIAKYADFLKNRADLLIWPVILYIMLETPVPRDVPSSRMF